MSNRIARLVGALFCLTAAGSHLSAGVIIVDPAGGPGATLLQAALDASQPGDILLLRAGDYSAPGAPTIKGLGGRSIVADTGAMVTLAGLHLTGIDGATTPTVLRDLEITPAPGNATVAFKLLATGRTWIEACRAVGSAGHTQLSGTTGFSIDNSPIVYIIRGDYFGGPGVDAHIGPGGNLINASGGGVGLACNVSVAVMQDTRATGGAGSNGVVEFSPISAGGAGLQLTGGSLASMLGGAFTGGDEGKDSATAGNSGSGAMILVTPLQTRDVDFVPGKTSGAGNPGLPITGLVFSLTQFEAGARTLALSSPARELQPVTATIHGKPGDLVTAIVATNFGGVSVPAKQAVFAFGMETTATILLGTITDPSGDLVITMSMPRLPPGVDGMVLFAQLGVVTGEGQALLGTASSVLWLSATL